MPSQNSNELVGQTQTLHSVMQTGSVVAGTAGASNVVVTTTYASQVCSM